MLSQPKLIYNKIFKYLMQIDILRLSETCKTIRAQVLYHLYKTYRFRYTNENQKYFMLNFDNIITYVPLCENKAKFLSFTHCTEKIMNIYPNATTVILNYGFDYEWSEVFRIFPNVEKLYTGDDFDQSLESICHTKLKSLYLNDNFTMPITNIFKAFPFLEKLSLPMYYDMNGFPLSASEHLTYLQLGSGYSENCDFLINYPNLVTIDFQNFTIRKMVSIHSFPKIKKVIFPLDYIKDIDIHLVFPNIEVLHILSKFDRDISSLNLCTNLKKLKLGSKFDREINITVPLEVLKFGYTFNRPLLINTKKLRKLHFGALFNKPLVQDFPELQYIGFGREFNQNVDIIFKSGKLVEAIFGSSFNKPLQITTKQNIRVLSFSDKYNQDINHFAEFLPLLYDLRFGDKFDQNIDAYKGFNIKYLRIGKYFKGTLELLDMPNVKVYKAF